MRLAIVGPCRDGSLHAHMPGCRDIDREQAFTDTGYWLTPEADSVEACLRAEVDECYPGNAHGDGATADAWEDVFHVLPCCHRGVMGE